MPGRGWRSAVGKLDQRRTVQRSCLSSGRIRTVGGGVSKCLEMGTKLGDGDAARDDLLQVLYSQNILVFHSKDILFYLQYLSHARPISSTTRQKYR